MRILQLLPEARWADAVTNQALFMDRALRDLGHETSLGADEADLDLPVKVQDACQAVQGDWDLVLDHFSIGADYHGPLKDSRGRRWLIYHNITPAHFLAPWAPEIAARCQEGRRSLPDLLQGCEAALADSGFNAKELRSIGHRNVQVLPIAVPRPPELDRPVSPSLARVFASRRPLLLFVGRIAPQKDHVALLKTLQILRKGDYPGAELILVGDSRGFEEYERHLLETGRSFGIGSAVHFLPRLPAIELWSLYRLADLFLCLSLHEGFCVPVVEAFLSRLPVVAGPAGAVPETAGGAALLAAEGEPTAAAECCHAILSKPDLAKHLVAKGTRRAVDFSRESLTRRLGKLLSRFTTDTTPPVIPKSRFRPRPSSRPRAGASGGSC